MMGCEPRCPWSSTMTGSARVVLAGVVGATAVACSTFPAPAQPAKTAGKHRQHRHRHARRAVWARAALSHYGEGDGTLGHRTACGRVLTARSWHVAALHPSLARCGLRLTLRYHGRRYRVTVQDRGDWRRDDRALDAAPGLRHAMRFSGVATIHYRKGWA